MGETFNVESFNLDHTKVKAPYVRLAGTHEGDHGDIIYKYDVRFKQPNKEHMEMPSVHSLEHLLAMYSRNYSDKIVDVSPMGCQTGFYLTVMNLDDYDTVLEIIEKVLKDVLTTEKVPATTEEQCGFAASHNLAGAKQLAEEMLAKRSDWKEIFNK